MLNKKIGHTKLGKALKCFENNQGQKGISIKIRKITPHITLDNGSGPNLCQVMLFWDM